jgi:hypothetical protein
MYFSVIKNNTKEKYCKIIRSETLGFYNGKF